MITTDIRHTDVPDIPIQRYMNIRVDPLGTAGLWNVSATGENATTYNIPCFGDEAAELAAALFRHNSELAVIHSE